MPLHSCDQRYSAGHEWRFWCGGSDRVGPAALLSRLPLTAPSTTDVAYPCDTSDSLLFRVWYVLEEAGLRDFSGQPPDVAGAQQVPGLYRFGFEVRLARRFTSEKARISHAVFGFILAPAPPNRKSSTQCEVPQCSVRTRRDWRGNRYHGGLDRCQWHSGNCRPLL